MLVEKIPHNGWEIVLPKRNIDISELEANNCELLYINAYDGFDFDLRGKYDVNTEGYINNNGVWVPRIEKRIFTGIFNTLCNAVIKYCGIQLPHVDPTVCETMHMLPEQVRLGLYNVRNPSIKVRKENNWKKQKLIKYLNECDALGFQPKWVDFFTVYSDIVIDAMQLFNNGPAIETEEFDTESLAMIRCGIACTTFNNPENQLLHRDYTYVGMPKSIITDYINGIPSFMEDLERFDAV